MHRTIGILEKISKVTYRLVASPELAYVHNVFHVLILRKHVTNPSHVLHQEPVEVHADLTYKGKPRQIQANKEKTLGNKLISRVKVIS